MSQHPSDIQLLIVTPARNEARNIAYLAESLGKQSFCPVSAWIVVDDGSNDGTAEVVQEMSLPFKTIVKNREKSGKLITGAAFAAWWDGVDYGVKNFPNTNFVMKLDADVVLAPDYFMQIFSAEGFRDAGIIGGVISDRQREQKAYVPGPVKMYSIPALESVRQLPIATGFDVMDEIHCRENGFTIQVVESAQFGMTREIGHSQGLLHGRYRNGLVSKWVGYSRIYFIFHMIRYLFRKPYFFGSIWMLCGFIFSSKGPYPQKLRLAHSRIQRQRLLKILRNPVVTIKELYF